MALYAPLDAEGVQGLAAGLHDARLDLHLGVGRVQGVDQAVDDLDALRHLGDDQGVGARRR